MSRSFVGASAPRLRCRQRADRGRRLTFVLLCSLAASFRSGGLRSSRDTPSHSNHADGITETAMPLTMQEAARLAAVDQPLLTGRQAKIQAEDQQAIAAAQLPDPQLSGGLKELPIDTPEAFSTRRDNFTEFTIGLSQEFPRAEKRRLQGARKQLDADADRAALDNERRMIRRDVSLAWLDVYETEQGLKLSQRLTSDEATLQVQALEKDYSNGKASQADWFAAKTDAGLAADKAHDWLHHELRMREGLARWIGDDAKRPIAESLADAPEL